MSSSVQTARTDSGTIAYSVVIPCYCSSPWLEELVTRIKAVMSETDGLSEVILVNDGSPDDTWETAKRLAEDNDFVTSIDLLHNAGQSCATLCGLKHARCEIHNRRQFASYSCVVHRKDRLRPFGAGGLKQRFVDIHRVRAYVDEDGPRTTTHDCICG
jgi:glycosyltransferase involved in cell wall biosynthesis